MFFKSHFFGPTARQIIGKQFWRVGKVNVEWTVLFLRQSDEVMSNFRVPELGAVPTMYGCGLYCIAMNERRHFCRSWMYIFTKNTYVSTPRSASCKNRIASIERLWNIFLSIDISAERSDLFGVFIKSVDTLINTECIFLGGIFIYRSSIFSNVSSVFEIYLKSVYACITSLLVYLRCLK